CNFRSFRSSSAPATREVDLLKVFQSGEKSSDTRFFFFGSADAQRYLLAGWSPPEKNQGILSQRTDATTAAFVFPLDRPGSTEYLHLRITSPSPNPTDIFLNSHAISKIVIDAETENFTVPIPSSRSEERRVGKECR